MNKKDHVLNGVLLGIGVGILLEPAGDEQTLLSVIAVSVPVTLGALFPDIDTAFGRHRKTLHNLPLLAGFVAFPYAFGNLQYVWIGILTHYVLDLIGSKRGLALLYPWDREFSLPFGVTTSSDYATLVTVLITLLELAVAAAIVFELPQEAFELLRAEIGV